MLAGKAADLMYDRANKIDQLLGNGTSLDDMPGDLGLVGVAGTMDAKGDTQDGTPAPIPGPPELKAAIIAAAFQAHQGDPPRLTEVQTPSTGGLGLLRAVGGKRHPARAKSRSTRSRTRSRRTGSRTSGGGRRKRRATAMMTAVQGGKSFSDAATVAGVTPKLSPLVTRNQGNPAIPADLQRIMFGLKKGEATMVETPEGFMVAQLTEIVKPDAGADKTGYDQARTAVTRSIGSDLETVFIDAVRQRAKPQINKQAFDSVVQAQQ